jgi:ABC-type phosphate/phosphonate transport system substrate-binding protein
MYDLPELREATDAWWIGLAQALRAEGVQGAPDELSRDVPIEEQWRSGDLLLSQTCGYPLIHELRAILQPVGTPCYAVAGCVGPTYSSVIVLHEGNAAASLGELRGSIAAVNRRDSHSGYNCLRAMIAPLARRRPFFSAVIETGAHARSIALVAAGGADVAAIDCVTYALMERYRPDSLRGTRRLGYTMRAPGLPYVTRVGAPPGLVASIRAALRRAVAAPELREAREALFIAGIDFLSLADYSPIRDIERSALDLGFDELR